MMKASVEVPDQLGRVAHLFLPGVIEILGEAREPYVVPIKVREERVVHRADRVLDVDLAIDSDHDLLIEAVTGERLGEPRDGLDVSKGVVGLVINSN